jgi:hypothetical protein
MSNPFAARISVRPLTNSSGTLGSAGATGSYVDGADVNQPTDAMYFRAVTEAKEHALNSAMIMCLCILLAAACPSSAEPLFPNSVVSNDLDFIHDDDPGPSVCLEYDGTSRAEMADKRHDTLFADDVHIFRAVYADGTGIGIWVHPAVGDRAAARALAEPVMQAVAKLPRPMRERLNHVVIHEGDETAFAEDVGRFFVLYSDNIRSRISTHDLQETVFHESVHATLDVPYASSAEWKAAQAADANFITEYAAENPDKEDLAESALFAWAVLNYPGRLPRDVEDAVKALMPNRLNFFEALLSGSESLTWVKDDLPC